MAKTPFEIMLDQVDYQPVERELDFEESDIPYVTHFGKLTIAGTEITVYVLNDGQRIIPCEDFARIFGELI